MPKVIDIKSKKPFKQSNKLCDEHQAEWVCDELLKTLRKAENKKINPFYIAIALAETCVHYVHETAPDTLSAQHLLNRAIGCELDKQMEERLKENE